MKKIVLISGILLIGFNTISALILSIYPWFNYGLVDFSILSTTFLLFVLFQKANADAYRIFLTFLFSFLLLVKIYLSISSIQSWINNIWILAILSIVIFEILVLVLIKYMRKHV